MTPADGRSLHEATDAVLERMGDVAGLGGEQRESLRRVIDLFLLDAPTCFLGPAASDSLAAALAPEKWPGTLVFTAQSRSFCEALRPNHVAHLLDGGIRIEERPPCDDEPPPPSTTVGTSTLTLCFAAIARRSSRPLAANTGADGTPAFSIGKCS